MNRRRALLGGLAGVTLGRGVRAAGLDPVTLAVSSTSLAFGGLRIAIGAGLFEKNGIALTVKVLESGSSAATAVLSGSVELCTASLGEVLAARVHGQKLVVVANIYRGLSGSLVLAKSVADGLGVSASAPLDARLKALGGLTVATPSATSSYTFPFRIAGQAVGAQPRFVYLAQTAMVPALTTGAVQGMIAGAPYSTEAVSRGVGVLWVNGPAGELPPDAQPTSSAAVEASEAYARSHPEIIARLRASFADLSTFIVQHPAEAERLLVSAYPQLAPDTVKAVFRSDSRNWEHLSMNVDDIRQEIALQARAGMLKGVEAIDPASVLSP